MLRFCRFRNVPVHFRIAMAIGHLVEFLVIVGSLFQYSVSMQLWITRHLAQWRMHHDR
jgi:hypothetical protein